MPLLPGGLTGSEANRIYTPEIRDGNWTKGVHYVVRSVWLFRADSITFRDLAWSISRYYTINTQKRRRHAAWPCQGVSLMPEERRQMLNRITGFLHLVYDHVNVAYPKKNENSHNTTIHLLSCSCFSSSSVDWFRPSVPNPNLHRRPAS